MTDNEYTGKPDGQKEAEQECGIIIITITTVKEEQKGPRTSITG